MKKIFTLLLTLLLSIASHGQSGKYISQFSHLQGYFNPALTAYEGSMVKGLFRSQGGGWEAAPRSYFVAAELDFTDLGGTSERGKNVVGVNLLNDNIGALSESKLILSYATRFRISNKMGLRVGAGLNISRIRLDGTSLSFGPGLANDPALVKYMGGFSNMNVVDLNIGVSITHPNYYLSYGVNNINEGKISSGDGFKGKNPRVGIAQAGYRARFFENLTVITNAIWTTQVDLPANVEFNMKLLLMDKFWVGGGHQVDYTNNAQLGILMGRLRFGYVYEWSMLKSSLLQNQSHEFLLSVRLFGGEAEIW